MRLKIVDVKHEHTGTVVTIEGLRVDDRMHAKSAEYVTFHQTEEQFGEVDWETFAKDLVHMTLEETKDLYIAFWKALGQWREERGHE